MASLCPSPVHFPDDHASEPREMLVDYGSLNCSTSLLDILAEVSLGMLQSGGDSGGYADPKGSSSDSLMSDRGSSSFIYLDMPFAHRSGWRDGGGEKRAFSVYGSAQRVVELGGDPHQRLGVEATLGSPKKRTKGRIEFQEANKSNSRTNFSEQTKAVWRKWALAHDDHPYPDDQAMTDLAESTSTCKQQVRDWFRNYRKREWWRSKKEGTDTQDSSS